jgi:hypothetical protein
MGVLPSRVRRAPMGAKDRRSLQVVGALAALLLTVGMIVRASVGLYSTGDESIVEVDPVTGEVVGGGVILVPGTQAKLFEDVELLPGQPVASCLRIEHRGDVRLDAVALRVSDVVGSPALLRALDLQVERGVAPAGGCDGFTPETATSVPLAAVGTGTVSGEWSEWSPVDGEVADYRFTLTLAEGISDELQGEAASTSFTWVATADPVGGDLLSRLLLLLAAVAREALLPLLLLIVVGVLFLGIQDRIDRQDPKLALAPVAEEPEPFLDPATLTWVHDAPAFEPVGGSR